MSRRQNLSTELMLWLATGPAKDNQTLAEVLKADPDTVRQSITRLQEKGYVTFNYQRNAHGGRPRFVDIRLTKDGERNLPDPVPHAQSGTKSAHYLPSTRPGDMTDYKNHPSHTSGGEVVRTVEVRPIVTVTEVRTETPPRSTWPILDALRSRMRGLDPLRIAANALDKDDPLRKDIETRIEMASKALTPAEQEYMDYAARHPGPKA